MPGKSLKPAYSIGHPKSKVRLPMFQCPVSAIPLEVFDLLELWTACHRMGTLPAAGGFLDQPLVVQKAFPVFQVLQQGMDEVRGMERAETQAALSAGGMAQALAAMTATGRGGRRR